jgi:hypothetical protein
MPKVTLYLPDDLAALVKGRDEINLSALLQDKLRETLDETAALEATLREKLEEYRNSPDRQAEWERREAGAVDPHAFVPCPTCGTGVDEIEGCMAMFEPYDAAPVALLAHFPAELRLGMLRYWRDSDYTDVPMGPV